MKSLVTAMVVMEPDMQHRMPWYDRYEASSGNSLINEDFFGKSCFGQNFKSNTIGDNIEAKTKEDIFFPNVILTKI